MLAGEILKEIKEHVEQGVSSQVIIKGLRRASMMAVNKIKEIAVSTDEANRRETLSKLAGTAMTSKLIKRNTEFFTKSKCTAVYLRQTADGIDSGGGCRALLRPRRSQRKTHWH